MNRLATSGARRDGGVPTPSGSYREFDVSGHPMVRQVWARRTTSQVGSPMFVVARPSSSVVAHRWDDRVEVESRPAGRLTESVLSPLAVGFVLHPWIDAAGARALHGAVARARWSDGADSIADVTSSVLAAVEAPLVVDAVVGPLTQALERSPDRATQQRAADRLGWSSRTIRRRFHSTTGMSVDRFRVVARAARVREALLGDRSSLADLAAEFGFADQSHLHRDFAELSGYTPSEWRRRAPAWAAHTTGM